MGNISIRIFSILFLFLAPIVAFSQSDASKTQSTSPSSANAAAVMPETDQLATGRNYFGGDLGFTYNWLAGQSNFSWSIYHQSTPFQTTSTYAQFDGLGSGVGFIAGLKAGVALSNTLDLEAKLRYLTNYTTTTEDHMLPVSFGATTQLEPVTNTYNLLLSNLDIAALLHFGFSDSWYAIGGPSFSTLLANRLSVSQTKNGGDNWSYYYTGTNTQSGDTQVQFQNQSQQNFFASSRVGLDLGMGKVFALGSGSTLLDAELLLSIPLTRWLQDSGETTMQSGASFWGLPSITFPKLWYATLTIGIRFPFGGTEAAPTASLESTSSQAEFGTNHGVGADGKVELSGRVTDAKSGQPIDATMTVVDLTNNEVVATDRTDNNGRYSVRVKAPGKYSITADADGYLFGTSYFEVDPQGRILGGHPDIKLSQTTNGRTRLLVFFDFNSSELKTSSYPELNRAVKLLKAVPTMQVEIAGYTDNVGAADYNLQLSQKRANAVRDYLIKNGINKNRVKAKGYGEESPIADNSTDDGRAENRRVEFVVLSK